MDAMECSGIALLYGGLPSKIAASIFYLLLINRLRDISREAANTAVAISLQSDTRKKAHEDQSLAQCWRKACVAISFRCSAFSTGGGRFCGR
ncbi:hypothetical protein EMIT0P176_60001 [Pseudomonas sp. IT-P176]